MSVFSVGGNVGFAIGPLLGSSLVVALGLEGGLLLAIPGLVAAGLLIAESGYLASFVPDSRRTLPGFPERDRPGAFGLLQGVVALRSIAHYGLFTFVPLWEVAQGASEAAATRLLSLFLFAGAIGTLIGGPLADRFGRKPVIVTTEALAAPLIVVYVLVGGFGGDVALVLCGAAVISTLGVTTVLSQEYLPTRIATASGLSVGLAIGLGGIFAVSLGALADSVDLETAVLATAAGPALAALLALALPPVVRPRLVETVPAASS
jgi:FSR family fosmidomycin resistance protein-like MFS transporter